jgi:hypothetical protein
MTIKFYSYSEIAELQNTFLFAMHNRDKIEQIRQLDERRAEQMELENKKWLVAQRTLRDATPDTEVKISL